MFENKTTAEITAILGSEPELKEAAKQAAEMLEMFTKYPEVTKVLKGVREHGKA